MPRCYMVKKGQRHEAPSPRSPSEASVAPPCYSPPDHAAHTESDEAQYTQLQTAETWCAAPARSAADTEAAHELLSLALGTHARPPPAPAPAPPPPPPPPPPPAPAPASAELLAYSLGSPTIYILADNAELYEEPAPSPAPSPPRSPRSPRSPPPDEPRSIPTAVIRRAAKHRPRYDCAECGKRYATSSNLSRHKQTHRSLDSGSARRCGECGKAYVSMPALAMHVLTHRMDHVCAECGKQFSRPWLLRGHLRSHTGEKPYSCDACGKAFADRSNLRAHLQTHSLDKRHECARCRKQFALKSYLNKHQESACTRDG